MKTFKQFTGKLNKTETAIMKAIEDNGHFTSERIQSGSYTSGGRNCNACRTLAKKGLIKLHNSNRDVESRGAKSTSTSAMGVWVKS